MKKSISTVTFGYRQEGWELHKWAYNNTNLKAIVLPSNRLEEPVTNSILDWASINKIITLIHSPTSNNFIDKLKSLNPLLILCSCYTYKLSLELLKLPKLGCINIHPGDLPKYSGRRPIEEALNNKEEELKVTLHYMDKDFDTGPIIAQDSIGNKKDILKIRIDLTKKGLQLLNKNWNIIIKEAKNGDSKILKIL